METRALFWGLESGGIIAFYVIGFSAIGAFILGLGSAVRKYLRGRPSPIPISWAAGIRCMAIDMLTHRNLRRRDAYAGAAHAAIFFGFVLLFIGTMTITVDYDLLRPLLGISVWKGTFFLVFGLVLDVAGLAAAFGLVMMMLRRGTFKLTKLNYRRDYAGETEIRDSGRRWRREDWIFLLALLVIILTGFLQEGLRHAIERPAWGGWEPVGSLLGTMLAGLGLSEASLHASRMANWWLHGLAALTFIAALPWHKANHMFAAMGSLASRDPLALRRLPKLAPDTITVGVGKVSDFSWKDLLDFDACTKCGRCHDVCPARVAAYPLSPRDLILDLRLHANQSMDPDRGVRSLIGDVIAAETLWSCRACGACQEICPVGIEHPTKIVQMRRRLVETDKLDALLRTALNAIGTSGNSFREQSRKRPAWTKELEFKVKDVRQEAADLLWFVGDQASFDPRNQKVSRTVARLFRAAKVDFGLLYESEKTAGNDVRRVGEEGLFESLAAHNLEQMAQAQEFRRIVTTDPHSFNTLRNEYPDFGKIVPIVHYTELLCELLESGALKVRKPLGLKVTFHDPCHLGRLNGRYEAPRRLLERIGCRLIEMPRNRENAFCCGAGGGRIWIPDKPGTQKPSEMRVREAAALGAIDVFVTCCPKDLTMFEDGRKTAGLENNFVVEDIAELVAKAIELDAISQLELPGSTEQITSASAERIAAVVPSQAVATPAPTAAPVSKTQGWNAVPVTPAMLPAYGVPAKKGVRILVAVKQIGKLGDDFSFSADQRSIPSEYFEYSLNEWDDAALEQALRTIETLKDGEVVVVTVGPPKAEDALRKALAKGAQRGVRVWDESLTNADPIAIARILAGVALQEQPDLIITGAQSGDQANGATGIALAKLLNLPRAALVIETEWDGGPTLRLTRELEGGLCHTLRIATPALITMQTGANVPRYATMRMAKQAKNKPIANVDAVGEATSFLGCDIHRMFVPQTTRAAMLEGSPDEVAAKVLSIIRDKIGANG